MNFNLGWRILLVATFVGIIGWGGTQAAIAEELPTSMGESWETHPMFPSSRSNSDLSVANLHPSPVTQSGDAAQLLLGTKSRSAVGSLSPDPVGSQVPASPTHSEDPVVAQDDLEVDPGRATFSGASYLGVGINVGFNEEGSPLGEGGFALISKIGLTEQVSVRPSVLFGDHLMLLVPVTIDFPPEDTEESLRINVAPYIGSGIALSTDTDNFIGFFGTVGIDAPLFDRFVATAGLNVGYVEEVEVGLLIGGSYTF